MSAKDLDALCAVLCGTSIETLQSLKDFDIWWLPPMEGSTRDEAVNSIRFALLAFDSCKYRIRCMAGLYCCLAQRQALRPWSCLVVVGGQQPMTREFTLHDSLASLWQRLRGYAVSVKVEWGDTIYACVMGNDEGCESLEHEVICVAAYRTRSLVYVYARRHVLFAVHCVHFVLRGPFKPAGYSGDLRHAFAPAPENQESSTQDPEKYGSLLDAYRVRRNPEKATNTQRTLASSLKTKDNREPCQNQPARTAVKVHGVSTSTHDPQLTTRSNPEQIVHISDTDSDNAVSPDSGIGTPLDDVQ